MVRFFMSLFLLYSSALFAQVSGGYGGKTSNNDNTNQFDIGIQSGVALTSILGEDVMAKYERIIPAYSGTVYGQYNFRKILSISLGLAYKKIESESVKGIPFFDSTGAINNIGSWATDRFEYFNLPLTLRASIGKHLKYSASIGVYYSSMIKQISVYSAYSNSSGTTTSVDTQPYERYDAGIVIGAGIWYPIRTMIPMKWSGFYDHLAFSAELVDQIGISDIYYGPFIFPGNVTTNSFNILIGICYRFKPRGYIIPA